MIALPGVNLLGESMGFIRDSGAVGFLGITPVSEDLGFDSY